MKITSDEVQRIYRNRFGPEAMKRKDQIWRTIVEDFLQRWVAADHTVLDLGCGIGEFLNHIRCARRIGIDLNPESQTFLAEGIEFHQGSVTSLPFLEDASVDVVFTSNLMEHLPGKREVEQMLREAGRVLKPGGHFIALGPNLRFLPGEYWDFWDHIVPITDRSLVEVLKTLGFEVVDQYPKFLPYTTCSRYPQLPVFVKTYLKIPLLWPLFGRQFLIRVQKP